MSFHILNPEEGADHQRASCCGQPGVVTTLDEVHLGTTAMDGICPACLDYIMKRELASMKPARRMTAVLHGVDPELIKKTFNELQAHEVYMLNQGQALANVRLRHVKLLWRSFDATAEPKLVVLIIEGERKYVYEALRSLAEKEAAG